MEIVYWTMKNGTKINVDDMSIEHLRNTLKMIIKNNQSVPKKSPNNISDAYSFSDEEINRITNKSKYQQENEDNLWKS